MFRDKIKVNRYFEKVKDIFLTSSDAKIIHQKKVTRTGVALKTILLFLIVVLCSMMSLLFIKKSSGIDQYIRVFYFLGFISSISFFIGIFFVSTSKICSLIFSMANGFLIGVLLFFLSIKYSNFCFIVFTALSATIFIFIFMSYLYYKGIFLATLSFKKKMFFITLLVIIGEIVRIIFFYFNNTSIETILYNSFLTIPISIFMIFFSSFILILHFDYVDQMIIQNMPNKYEWQLSLCFISLFISIFLRILELLLIILDKFKNK